MQQLIVIGSGGFSKDVVWAIQHMNAAQAQYNLIGYCDDDPAKQGRVIYGHTVLGTIEQVHETMAAPPCFICSIGSNPARARVVERAIALGWQPVTIIDPSVLIADEVQIGVGTYIGARAILSPKAVIGDHVLINNHTTIGHDCVIGNFAQVSPGGRISGASVLREGALVGANAVVAQGRSIGRHATLGAGSFAMTNIPDEVTAVGNPAKVIFRNS